MYINIKIIIEDNKVVTVIYSWSSGEQEKEILLFLYCFVFMLTKILIINSINFVIKNNFISP